MMKKVSEKEFLGAYDSHADALYRFAVVHTYDAERARDAVQEAFVRTWKYIADGQAIEALRPFLYRTLRNILIDASRRMPAESLEALQEEGFDVADRQAEVAVSMAEANLALAHLTGLEPYERELIIMRFIDDLGPSEIAQVTGMSQNVVSVRIHRALHKLRTLMHIS